VAYSADGARVALALADRTIVVREAASWKELGRLEGHQGTVSAVAFSADGSQIVSGSSDKSVRLWDATTYKPLARLDGHADAVTSIAVRPNNNGVISASADGTIRIWNTQTHAETMKLRDHTDSVLALALSPDGAWFASGSIDATTRLWTLPDAQLRLTLRALAGRDDAHAVARGGAIEFFPANGSARAFPICSFGADSMPFALCAERFVVPDLVPRVMSGDTSYELP
jgi:WD40 repeat protein